MVSNSKLWKWVAGLKPVYVIAVFSLLVLLAVFFTLQLRFSYDYEDFFPENDPDLAFYDAFRQQFEPDDNFLLVGMQPENGLFDAKFLTSLDSATNSVGRVEGAERAYSVTNFRYFVKSPFGFIDYPAVHPDDSSRFESDSLRLAADVRVVGKLVSEDFSTVVILIKTNDSLSQQKAKSFVADVRAAMHDAGIKDYHLLGKANFEVELVEIQKKEFLIYAMLSIVLVTIVTFLMFRKIWCVVLSVLTVAISLILFTGILGGLRIEQNVMSTLYPIVIIIIGISDAVHFIGKYITELRKNNNRKVALFRTLSDIGFATWLTAVTSAIGFLTMLTSNVPPIKDFGLYSALGVLVVYAVVLFFISPVLTLFRLDQLDAKTDGEDKKWTAFINAIYTLGIRRKRRILIIMSAAMLIFIYGVTQISTNIHLEAGMPKGAQVTTDFHFFEEHFNGFRPLEIAAEAKGKHLITEPAIIRDVEKVETYASSFDLVNGLQGMTMPYKSMHRAYNGDIASYYRLPENDSILYGYQKLIDKYAPREMHALISSDKKAGRISGFLSDVGTDSIRMFQTDLKKFIEEKTDTSAVKFTITGTGVIFDKNTQYLRKNIISGVLLAFFCIGIVMAYLFRDWRMVIISIIPNILPLIVCAGIMGLLGIELDAPTSIIFGISYGIAVDDTIHFLSKFRIERQKGYPLEIALQNTFQETGKAVFTMSAILFFGFMILMLSSTSATFNIGLLTGVTLFTAIWPDVFLIPILLRMMKTKL